jgi:asparagine synthase (glutamine-hydrolysing)
VATLEASLYMRNQLLRDTDWASMAHSLEVRVPLVDATLLKTLAPQLVAPGFALGKGDLATAPSRPLPEAVVSRPKTGFSTPIASWLQRSAYVRRRASVPALTAANCPWARHWACQVGAGAGG